MFQIQKFQNSHVQHLHFTSPPELLPSLLDWNDIARGQAFWIYKQHEWQAPFVLII